MFRTMLAAVVAAGSFPAPAAVADAPTYDCRWVGFKDDLVTGGSYQGVLVGFVVHGDGSSASIRCYVTVNGVSATTTPTGSGAGFASTQKDTSFAAGDTDIVQVCAAYTSSHGSGSACTTLSPVRVPPAVVTDLVDEVTCDTLRPGTYGPVTVEDDGDVTVGRLTYDCPPYGS